MRFFNTAGPVRPTYNYCLPPLSRFDLDGVLTLVDQQKYFVLHAPRQTGKTSCLLALVDYLNNAHDYCAVYANVEVGQSARENVGEAMRAILGEIGRAARDMVGDRFILDGMSEALAQFGPHGALRALLGDWAAAAAKPILLTLDEVD
ncbi:MAG: ATP-binding protein, partial [Armatimonadota bacterium]|nr:ATP-binding protein [Armatimonadota bacterium]